MEHVWKACGAGKKCLEKRPEWGTEEVDFALQLSKSQGDLISRYGTGAVSAVKAVIGIYKSVGNPSAKAREAVDKIRGAKDKQKLDLTENRTCGLLENAADGAAEAALLTSSDEAQDENFMDVIIKSSESGSFSNNAAALSRFAAGPCFWPDSKFRLSFSPALCYTSDIVNSGPKGAKNRKHDDL